MSRTLTIPVLDFRAILLDGLRTEYNKPRIGIHASDLVNCRRQVAFERIAGHREFTEQTLMYFASGEFQHQKLQSLLGEEFDCEKEIIWNDIVFHPDVVWKPHNVVIEIKTARTDSVIKEPKAGHIRQLKYYMAVLNAPYGILQYIIMNKYDKDLFPVHYITLEHDEREKILEQLQADGEELRAGIELKDPSLVGHIARNEEYIQRLPSGYEYNWLCKGCQFKEECNEMRAKAGEFQRRADQAQAQMMKIPESWRPK